MKQITAVLAAGVVAVGLSACSTINSVGSAVSNVISAINSDVGQAFIKALGTGGSITTSISSVIKDINTGIASPVAQDALKMVCYSLPWAQGALDILGPSANISATIISETDAAVAAFLDGPCTKPPLNLAQIITDGTKLYVSIVDDLQKSGVPVAVPATSPTTAAFIIR
jgi:hypothetical protein